MNAKDSPPPIEANAEIAALIATLHETGQRLEELTTGEVDTVADREGHTFVLRHVQEKLRISEAAKLAASELRFRVMIQNVSDVITLIATDGVVLYVNPSVKDLGGYEPDELIGRNFFELLHPDDVARGLEVLAEINRSPPGSPVRAELRYRHKNGTWLVLESISRNMSHLPEIGGVVVVARDVTKRKAAEDILSKRAAELERFNRLSVGREMQMIELKKQINELAKQAGQQPPYDLAFLSPQAATTNLPHEPSS